MSLLSPEEVALISSVTSTNIQKIVIRPFLQRGLRVEFWSTLDAELNGLVDRLRASGYRYTLELVLQHDRYFARMVSAAGPDGFLQKFREKGRVTISESRSGRILYCSDGLLGGDLGLEDSTGSETTQAAPPQGFSAIV